MPTRLCVKGLSGYSDLSTPTGTGVEDSNRGRRGRILVRRWGSRPSAGDGVRVSGEGCVSQCVFGSCRVLRFRLSYLSRIHLRKPVESK